MSQESESESESGMGTPAQALPLGRMEGRQVFADLVRQAMVCAAREGWSHIVLSDSDFADWPLGERVVVDGLGPGAGRRPGQRVQRQRRDGRLRRGSRGEGDLGRQHAGVVHKHVELGGQRVYALHKSIGLTVLGLTVLRLLWRLVAGAPEPVPGTPRWQSAIAQGTHGALYAILLAMPLSGWLYNSAAGFPLQWFGVFKLPALSGRDPGLKEFAGEAHEWLFIALALCSQVVGQGLLVYALGHVPPLVVGIAGREHQHPARPEMIRKHPEQRPLVRTAEVKTAVPGDQAVEPATEIQRPHVGDGPGVIGKSRPAQADRARRGVDAGHGAANVHVQSHEVRAREIMVHGHVTGDFVCEGRLTLGGSATLLPNVREAISKHLLPALVPKPA